MTPPSNGVFVDFVDNCHFGLSVSILACRSYCEFSEYFIFLIQALPAL